MDNFVDKLKHFFEKLQAYFFILPDWLQIFIFYVLGLTVNQMKLAIEGNVGIDWKAIALGILIYLTNMIAYKMASYKKDSNRIINGNN